MNKKKLEKFIFIPGELNQWKKYKNKNFIIWLAGINLKDKLKKIDPYLNDEIDKIDKNKLISILGNQFGILILHDNWVFTASDFTRSYPIYWKLNKTKIFLSPQARLIKKSTDKINHDQLQAYRMSGYTTNDQTLWKNIYNLKSGTYLIFTKKFDLSLKQYFTYQPWKIKKKRINIYKNILKQEINKLFLSIIKEAKGRRIIVPLSAGLDSRLIISGLKKYNYKNVKCFSYGLKNNFETIAAKKIAQKLGYKWKFVEIKYKEARVFYTSAKFNKYIRLTNDGVNVPSIHSLYAIDFLLKSKFITRNDIVINGNSGDFISGGHIPKNIKYLKNPSNKLQFLFDRIFDIHFKKH